VAAADQLGQPPAIARVQPLQVAAQEQPDQPGQLTINQIESSVN
jgi:hypothetical protein